MLPTDWLGYWRKSVGRKGIAQQRLITTAAVEAAGGRIVFERDDKDATAFRHGTDRAPRPGFDEVLGELRRRPGAGIAVWHLDRALRDIDEAHLIVDTKCTVLTASGGTYDLSTATDRKRFRGDVVDAQYEVDHNIERCRERKDEHASEGRWMGGGVPFGWTAIPREDDDEPALLDLDTERSELIMKAARDVLAGAPVHAAMVVPWNAAGILTARGNRWNVTTAKELLLRPRNAALHEHRGKVRPGAQWPPLRDGDGEFTAKMHEQLTAILTGRPRRPGSDVRKHLLSGIALCGECGRGVQCRPHDRVQHYFCPLDSSHPVRKAERVDEYVIEHVMKRLERADAAKLLKPDTTGERSRLITRRAALEGAMKRDREWQQEGIISDAEFIAGRRAAMAELEAISGQLAELDRGDAVAPFLSGEPGIRAGEGRMAPRDRWAAADLAARRAVVLALVHVTLFPGRPGRPAGWKPGQPYFDYPSVDVRWARQLAG